MYIVSVNNDHEHIESEPLSSNILERKTSVTLWHNMDISNFQCHKNVNFHNNFVGLMIADDLKSKI